MIPTKTQLSSGAFKLINGIWHKKCTGPAHEQPEWLPANRKYFIQRNTGKRETTQFVARCRLCHNWEKLKAPVRGSLHGYVPVADVRPFYIEAVNRVGVTELHRRSGISKGHILRVLTDTYKKFVEKATLRKIMLELVSMQRRNESQQNELTRWRTDRRNNGHIGTCAGCGGSLRNVTRNCETCKDRHYRWFRRGKITRKEWEAVKLHF